MLLEIRSCLFILIMRYDFMFTCSTDVFSGSKEMNSVFIEEQLTMPVEIKWSCGIGASKLNRIEFILNGILIFCNWDLKITHGFVRNLGGMYYLNVRFQNKRHFGIL